MRNMDDADVIVMLAYIELVIYGLYFTFSILLRRRFDVCSYPSVL